MLFMVFAFRRKSRAAKTPRDPLDGVVRVYSTIGTPRGTIDSRPRPGSRTFRSIAAKRDDNDAAIRRETNTKSNFRVNDSHNIVLAIPYSEMTKM